MRSRGIKILAENKRTRFNYQILEIFESGIILTGQEVKSVKAGRINLAGSFVILRNGEAFLVGAKIPPWQPKNAPQDYNPERSRKLFLRKSELKSLIGQSRQKGLTLVPTRVYNKGGLIKVEFAVAKGKRMVDKRQSIKKREVERSIRQVLKRSTL